MLQIHNSTAFEADFALLPDKRGVDTIYPVLKATFDVVDQIRYAETQIPLYKSDVYRGDPASSGIDKLGEYHLLKPGTDVIVQGDCRPHGGASKAICDVAVTVGDVSKRLRVFGDRCWRSGRISEPEPFECLPLIYDRAFGGNGYELNPLGLGYQGQRSEAEMENSSLPNIENPDELIRTPECAPVPVGVEAVPPYWPWRRHLAGTYDEVWQRQRAPFLPTDFDDAFFFAASPGMSFQSHTGGGQRVRIDNMHPTRESWEFVLPHLQILCQLKWRGQLHEIPMVIETITILPNDSRFTYTLRGAFPVNQWALRLEYLDFSMKADVSGL